MKTQYDWEIDDGVFEFAGYHEMKKLIDVAKGQQIQYVIPCLGNPSVKKIGHCKSDSFCSCLN